MSNRILIVSHIAFRLPVYMVCVKQRMMIRIEKCEIYLDESQQDLNYMLEQIHTLFSTGCARTCWWRTCSREMTDQGNNNQNISQNPFAALFSSLADAKQFASVQKQRRQAGQQCKYRVINGAVQSSQLHLQKYISFMAIQNNVSSCSCRFRGEPIRVGKFSFWQHWWQRWLRGRDQPIFSLTSGALRAAQCQPHDPKDLPYHTGQQWVLNNYLVTNS